MKVGTLILQLESYTLERLCGALHDFLSGGCGASERDLVDTRVGSEPWAEIVVTAECLHDAWWEESLSQLRKLEATVRRERTGLDNDTVSRQKRRGNLPTSFSTLVFHCAYGIEAFDIPN